MPLDGEGQHGLTWRAVDGMSGANSTVRRGSFWPALGAALASCLFVAGPRASGATIAVDSVSASPASVPKYGRVELAIALSHVAATKFYDPAPAFGGLDLSATFTSPTKTVWNLKGFYDGAGWRVRFAPNEAGTWLYAVTASDPSGTSNTAGGTFECVASGAPGWAQIDGPCLRFAEGQVLFGVGHNTGWQLDVEQPPLASMAAKGENLLSFWLATPWAEAAWGAEWAARTPIENVADGIGNYNQAACAYLDAVVERAEAAGVCLLPTIWSHGQLRAAGHPWGEGWWYNNAYSTVCTAADFFELTSGDADTPQWRLQKNLYRYLIARWGYSPAIAGWMGICEIEGTSGWVASQSKALAWCAAVRDYFRANDPFRRNAAGKSPIAGTRVNAPDWEGGFDLRATDSYASETDDTAVALTIASDTQTMRASGRPAFHAEFGGNTTSGASQPTHLHNGIWAGAATGAAITPLVWCDGGSFPMLTPEMLDHLQHLAQFMAAIDYLGNPGLAAASVSISGTGCRGWGMKLADRGYAWVQNTVSGSLGGQTVSIPGLATGHYAVAWYDAWTSGATPILITTIGVYDDGVLRATIPALARADIALRFATTGNTVPTAADDAWATSEDTPLSVPAPGVLANDTDPESDPLSAAVVAGPAHGTLTLNPDGSFAYSPAANYHGPDSFTYKASDGWAFSNTATVSLTVSPVNDPPIASSDHYTTNQDQSLDVAAAGVLANDTDADGDPLTAVLADGPAHGAVTLRADGSFTYTPTNGYSGTDAFTYEAYDGTTLSNETTVTIAVAAAGPTAVLAITMSKSTSKTSWKAKATVKVKDASGKAIAGATVAGHWSGVTTGAVSATTNNKGSVAFTSAPIAVGGTATFTVDSVTKNGVTYTLAGQTSGSIAGAPKKPPQGAP